MKFHMKTITIKKNNKMMSKFGSKQMMIKISTKQKMINLLKQKMKEIIKVKEILHTIQINILDNIQIFIDKIIKIKYINLFKYKVMIKIMYNYLKISSKFNFSKMTQNSQKNKNI